MKAQVHAKAKSSVTKKNSQKRSPARKQQPAWTRWLEALALEDVDISTALDQPVLEPVLDTAELMSHLDVLLETEQTTPLPFQSLLEDRLGQSLSELDVYAGTPVVQEILQDLGATAAYCDRKILLGDPQPSLETVTHEVVHALQTESNHISQFPTTLSDSAPAEKEAQQLTQEIVASIQAPSADRATLPWTPVVINNSLPSAQIACLRDPPPATVSEASTPQAALAAQTEPDRAVVLAPQPTTTPTPAEPSEAQADTEAALDTVEESAPITEDLESVPALEVPAPPAPGITAEDVAAREAELAAAESALANATDVDEKVAAYAAAPPTLKAQSYGTLGADMDAIAKAENEQFQAEMPDFEAKLSGQVEEPPEVAVEPPPTEEISLEESTPEPAPEPEITPTDAPVAYTGNDGLLRAVARFTEGTSPQDRASEIGDTLSDVATTDPDVETSPGPPPAVPLEGETDPERIENQLTAGRDRAIQSRDQAQQSVLNGPGPEQIQPVVMAEPVPLENLTQPELTQPEAVPGIDDFSQREMPAEVNTAFDLANQETMQASMAEAQGKVQEATDARDRDRQEKVNAAQTEADRQTLEADAAQRREVQTQREAIQGERQQTLNDQADAVRQVETDAETRRRTDQDAIDSRVRDDQATIRDKYAEAERDSEGEVRDGERQATEKKRKAERDADNESWWDRAVNFVKEAFAALTEAIGAIFDAVREAINKILDAVKAAALELIDKAANFIRSAINAFSEFLQGAVNALLRDRFPELANNLNNFIDNTARITTEAVDEVANNLKASITALIEGLRAGLNAVMDVLQAGLELASGLIQAALSGDWGEVLRLMLEAVLKVIGVEPETFYSFIGRAQETFGKIIDDPGAVVTNLLDAVKLGFQKFADGFLDHLKAGIIGWLTGALGGDLEIPTEFNLIGVLDLARQIMGLTLAFIRRIAVRLIGEENVERIEAVIEQVQNLISNGWSGLLEQLAESLNNIQEMVIGQIKEFLVTQLVLAAITKLASLFNPVGAIVQIVLTLWNIFNFLRENLERLSQIVQTIVNSISQIVEGVIETAASSIETVLANLLPVAISFIANLLGLSGIGRRVSHIIGRLRERIENAIVHFIRRIASRLAGRRRGSANPDSSDADSSDSESGLDSINISKPFSMDGESHHLFARVVNEDLVIEMASDRREKLQRLIASVKNSEELKRMEGSEREKLIDFLNRVSAEIDEIDEFEQVIKRVGYSEQTPQQLENRMGRVIGVLEALGRELSIESLSNIESSLNEDVERLKEAIELSGIVQFMEDMAEGKVVNGITRQQFASIFEDSDKKIGGDKAEDWIKNKFRNVRSNTHEWIPVDLIPAVVQRAASATDFLEGVKWIRLQNELRTDTSWVIFKESKGDISTLNGVRVVILQGHVGAIYLDGSAQTKGSSDFHQELQDIFNANISIASSVDQLKAVFVAWVWKGDDEPLSAAAYPGLTWKQNGSDLTIAVNLSSLSRNQASRFSQTENEFNQLKRKYG